MADDFVTTFLQQHGISYTPGDKVPIEVPKVTRTDLGRWFAEWGFTRGAEIGVWRGDYSQELLSLNPRLHLYGVDPWRVHAAYRDHTRQYKLDNSYEMAKAAVAPYGDRCTLIRDFSVSGAKVIPNGSLDFVYIDGNHRYECVVEDLAAWIPKVRVGGIISGHDYAWLADKHLCHVIPAVNGWAESYKIAPWFVLGRGRDAKKYPGDKAHAFRSWMWVNA